MKIRRSAILSKAAVLRTRVRCTGIIVLAIAMLFCITAHAWYRKSYSDQEIVIRSELIVVGRIDPKTLTRIEHKDGGHEYHVELLLSDLLKGMVDKPSMTISIHYGIDARIGPVPSSTNVAADVVRLFDTGNNLKTMQPLTGDIRTNHIWLLHQEHLPGIDTDWIGVYDPEDIQPVSRKDELLKYLNPYPAPPPPPADAIEQKTLTAVKAISEHQSKPSDLFNLSYFESVHRQEIIRGLISILNDPQSKNSSKRSAAYYLGELRAAEAADDLATNITLNANSPVTGTLYEMEAEWNGAAAESALCKIGAPAIPALIRNLSTNDDQKVRLASLWVLCRIEGDKDIVQLRLQKALKAEKDPQKTARLQGALDELPGMKYPH